MPRWDGREMQLNDALKEKLLPKSILLNERGVELMEMAGLPPIEILTVNSHLGDVEVVGQGILIDAFIARPVMPELQNKRIYLNGADDIVERVY